MSLPELINGRSPSFFQAENMGIRSGVVITPAQASLYEALREKPLDRNDQVESDQVLMARVLRETHGPVDVFEAAYPNIFKRT